MANLKSELDEYMLQKESRRGYFSLPSFSSPSFLSRSSEDTTSESSTWFQRVQNDYFTWIKDEALTCNVCDRSFPTRRQLADHQQKKRHFGCSACDSLFPSLMALEHHKEEFQHWSDSSYCSHSDSDDSEGEPCHDRHRLL